MSVVESALSFITNDLMRLVKTRRSPRLLLIDDDEIDRYLVRTRLAEARSEALSAAGLQQEPAHG